MLIKLKKGFKSAGKYLIELLIVFIGVYLAFGLNNLNENRKRNLSEDKILAEIKNGLDLDLIDLEHNIRGHQTGIRVVDGFVQLVNGETVISDSIDLYLSSLTRDYISIQNQSGYESLKSQGLDIIQNDSLRFAIISLYDFHYEIIQKLEEVHSENQFYQNYYPEIQRILGPYLRFNEQGKLVDVETPIQLNDLDRNTLLSYFWRIKKNRGFTMMNYNLVKKEVEKLLVLIDSHLEDV